MLEHINTGEPWKGERINGIAHPRSIETAWDADALQAVGLRVRPVPVPPDPPLVELKADLSAEVDRDAERVRLKYITPGDGMAMTYREKFEQAELVNELGETAANALSEADRTAAYPTLAASVGLEANTLWDCAQLVRTAYSQFAVLSNTIEKTRLAGKKAISNASTVQAARDAYEAITWTV